MVQAAGKVNVIAKLGARFYDWDGTRQVGDGATAADVTRREALDMALDGRIVAASDVKVRATDFADFLTPLTEPTSAATP